MSSINMAYAEKRMGRLLLSEAYVTSGRSREIFNAFLVLLAAPRYEDPGLICYYGAHPGFEPFDGEAKDSPYYQPYWNEDGIYFKKTRGE